MNIMKETSIFYVSSLVLAIIFFSYLLGVLFQHPRIFLKRHGRAHAILGLCYLFWLLFGFSNLISSFLSISSKDETSSSYGSKLFNAVVFDIVLGLLGIALPLSAAFEFKHHGIKNVASGTLDEHATVTHNEMIEHAFYQAINLLQILFLHCCYWVFLSIQEDIISIPIPGLRESSRGHYVLRFLLLSAVSSPWLVRNKFPVNRFSDNYIKIDQRSTALVRTLYRIKKYQYIFYKHFLLHGLNITVVLIPSYIELLFEKQGKGRFVFRLYWLLLNTSYVMEFFLQTLVKKKYMKQGTMLGLQHVLMVASSLVAVFVLQYVNVYVALSSLSLNFLNRKFDFLNTMLIYLVAIIYTSSSSLLS